MLAETATLIFAPKVPAWRPVSAPICMAPKQASAREESMEVFWPVPLARSHLWSTRSKIGNYKKSAMGIGPKWVDIIRSKSPMDSNRSKTRAVPAAKASLAP